MKKIFFAFLLLSFLVSCKSDDNPSEESITYPTPELLEYLSELNLFKGDLKDLMPTDVVTIYDLQTPLFTDYCHKKRFLSIPKDKTMTYDDGGFPIFPDNTILAKTFYYNKNENDLSQGKIIIETRVLIKKAGIWEIGNYIWNDDQTDAIRDEAGLTKTISWIDENGSTQSVDYKVPDYATCVMCHTNQGVREPIGPKIRNMNKGIQLQRFIDKGILIGITDLNTVEKLPVWNDTNYTPEERARAYLDVNCAHCHQPGGYYNMTNHDDSFEFRYETRFSDTHIYNKRDAMLTRIESSIDGYKMPFVGTTLKHTEGVDLLNEYLNSL
jgi:uncharacterized repeat protein (TIGR03806 family)